MSRLSAAIINEQDEDLRWSLLVQAIDRIWDVLSPAEDLNSDSDSASDDDSDGGLTETDADARYLRIAQNLADVDSASTSRTNLGVGTADDVTFRGVDISDHTGDWGLRVDGSGSFGTAIGGGSTGSLRLYPSSSFDGNTQVVVSEAAVGLSGVGSAYIFGNSTVRLATQGNGYNTVYVQTSSGGRLRFFGGVSLGAGSTKQTVTGSKGGNAALASLITALAAYGLITDNTT